MTARISLSVTHCRVSGAISLKPGLVFAGDGIVCALLCGVSLPRDDLDFPFKLGNGRKELLFAGVRDLEPCAHLKDHLLSSPQLFLARGVFAKAAAAAEYSLERVA